MKQLLITSLFLTSFAAQADFKEPTPWGVYRDVKQNEASQSQYEQELSNQLLIDAALWCEHQGLKGDIDCIASKYEAEAAKAGLSDKE